MRLLLIEDEQKIGLPLKKALERHQYAVDYCVHGSDGFEKASITSYDCIVLDLNLPGMDGITLAKRLRSEQVTTPILMLTARTAPEDVIEGFQSGTDDYLLKPFNFQELLLRIQALIRRSSLNRTAQLTCDDLVVDTTVKKVYKAGQEIVCNAKEYGILEYLLRNSPRTVSQEELLEHVWDSEIDTFTQTVRTNIKTLRHKVDPDKTLIRTIKGSGYAIEHS